MNHCPCGKPIPNDTYGSRCEDCWAEAHRYHTKRDCGDQDDPRDLERCCSSVRYGNGPNCQGRVVRK